MALKPQRGSGSPRKHHSDGAASLADIHVCLPSQFKCTNTNRCIPGIFRCNGQDNCGDGEDEKDCREWAGMGTVWEGGALCLRVLPSPSALWGWSFLLTPLCSELCPPPSLSRCVLVEPESLRPSEWQVSYLLQLCTEPSAQLGELVCPSPCLPGLPRAADSGAFWGFAPLPSSARGHQACLLRCPLQLSAVLRLPSQGCCPMQVSSLPLPLCSQQGALF